MKWNPKLHPRDGDNGRFTENWTARLAEQMMAARQRGDVSSAYLPVRHGSDSRPHAANLGYVRVGDHPTRMGAVGGAESYFGSSTHPDAGGVWVDPARPGTSRAPQFRNDYGSPMAQLKPVPSRSQRHKDNLQSRRGEDWSGTGDRDRRPSGDGGKIGRRLEGAPAAAVKEMRRAQARARIEGSSRTPKRRTPRGTQVDSWMDKVSDSIGQKGSGRG
jgi:hypothetical protein